jgi:hypothetical protein
LTPPPLPRPREALSWIAAACTAAAMLYVPAIVFLFGSSGPDPGAATAIVVALLVLAVVAVAAFARLSPEPAAKVVPLAVATAAFNALAAFGVLVLVIVGGSCGDDGHVGPLAWGGAIAIYLVGATVALRRRPVHALWAVPASLVVGGLWLVGIATLLTGSTGSCLE